MQTGRLAVHSVTFDSCSVEFKEVSLLLGERLVLQNVSFKLPKNKLSLLMGASGAGKTSILRLITGQIQPDKGQVLINGKQISYSNQKELYSMRKSMGMVFQSSALFSDLTVAENIAVPLVEHAGLAADKVCQIVSKALNDVSLSDAANLYSWQLSGGMQKRTAFARAGILNPEIMLYDEPLAGQDPVTCQNLMGLIAARNSVFGNAAIIVSHKIELIMKLIDHVVMLKNGEVLFAGNVLELSNNKTFAVSDFVQNCNWPEILQGKQHAG